MFRGVDFYFFNLKIFQSLFILFSSFWIFFIIYKKYFLNFSFFFLIKKFLKILILKRLQEKRKNLKGWVSFMWRFFLIIMIRNLVGLIPYVYGLTTKIYFVFIFSLWGWFRLIFSSFIYNFFLFIGHLCPLGAPNALGWFLRIVEVVRIRIRPGTLTLRLVAKMTTGHILIGLITLRSCFLFFKKFFLRIFRLIFLLGYVIFEIAICFIQGKVFFMLFQSYTAEHL